MPELPEVETTRRGISKYVVGKRITNILIRERRLRWLIPKNLNEILKNTCVIKLTRRAKYLLFYTNKGCLIVHLGMSGSLRVVKNNQEHIKHDHVDFIFESEYILRFHDPRKFGSILWTDKDPTSHKLIAHLGPEPLSEEFNDDYLYAKSKKHSLSIKSFIMNNKVVVGIGNIYANEALFLAGINPKCKVSRISKKRYKILIASIKKILTKAITKGGTTLRDYVSGDGLPGYFANELKVYNRSGELCSKCKKKIKTIKQNQRSTFYCAFCQT